MQKAGRIITSIGAIIPGLIIAGMLIYFVLTGTLFPIGFQEVNSTTGIALFFFAYTIGDIFLIFWATRLMKNAQTLRKGSIIAIIAGILGFGNMFAIIGGIVGLIGSFGQSNEIV